MAETGGLRRVWWTVVLMGVVLPVAGWGQADTKPSDAKPAGEQAATVEKVPEAEKALTAEKTEGLTERQREIAEGNARLLKLAADLRKEIEKSAKGNTLSIAVIRRAEEIEKLAHTLKQEMNAELKGAPDTKTEQARGGVK